LRRSPFRFEKLGDSSAFQITHRIECRVRMRDLECFLELAHGPEEERFIVRALDEELQLRVLVGNAESCRRRLSIEDLAFLAVISLAQAFSPQLFEPECEFPKC